MAVLKILPSFKNDEERYMVAAAIGLPLVCGGYLSFIPPLVIYFGFADKLSAVSKTIVRQYINFMINIALAMFICTFTIIGAPLALLIGLAGLIYLIIDLLAVLNKTEVQIPVFIEFLKESSAPVSSQESKDELKP